MMYYYQSIQEKIKNFEGRIERTDVRRLKIVVKDFIDFLEKTSIIKVVLNNLQVKYPNFTNDEFYLTQIQDKIYEEFPKTPIEAEAAFCYNLLKLLMEKPNTKDLLHNSFVKGGGNSYDGRISDLKDSFIKPLCNYLYDILEQPHHIIYLFERYKKRIEWYTYKELKAKYDSEESKKKSEYEKVLNDDLCLFLYDNGLDFVFSQLISPSGEADAVAELTKENSIIVEVKFLDNTKQGYKDGTGKKKIIGGFKQLVGYTNDFNKNEGYFIIFNMTADEVKIELDFEEKDSLFPPRIFYDNKYYSFIVISFREKSASNSNPSTLKITEKEFRSEVS